MPQDIDISGHTDATLYLTDKGYSNWELSADRANAARRALLMFGVPEARVARVAGRAATDPLIANNPEADGNAAFRSCYCVGPGRVGDPEVQVERRNRSRVQKA